MDFLINCHKYKEIREELFPKFDEKIPDFLTLQQDKIFPILLGEDISVCEWSWGTKWG